MGDREVFRSSVYEYLKMGKRNWKQLAQALHFSREHMSKIFHGKATMPDGFVHAIVITLAELGCLHTRDQAKMLLGLMDTDDFRQEDWSAHPLSALRNSSREEFAVDMHPNPSQQHYEVATLQDRPPSLFHVPYQRNFFFTGRDDLLHLLREKLTTTKAAALTQAISGLGGIGKTQIALEYAYRYRDRYPAILWIRAATREILISDFVTLAEMLQVAPITEPDQNKLVHAVKQWLTAHNEWLLILDNADDLTMVRDFLPTERQGHILLTTRAQAVGTLAQRITVENMGMAEGSLLLLRRAKILAEDAFLDQASEEQLTQAEAIAIEIDFLPLALDQAGAYIEETGCNLSTYLDVYRTHRKALLQRRGFLSSDHPESVATMWSLAFEKIERVNASAVELLYLCAFLNADVIPEELISEGATYFGPKLHHLTGNEFALNEAIEELRKFSLIQRHADTRTLSIHRLVQAVLQDEIEEEMQLQWVKQVIQAVNSIFPNAESSTWSLCQRYLPQAQTCAEFIEQYDLMLTDARSLLLKITVYLREHALYDEAQPLAQRALQMSEHTLEPNHPEIVTPLLVLAFMYIKQRRYEEAEPLFQRALAIRELVEAEHTETANIYSALAVLYRDQGKREQAIEMIVRALTIRRNVLKTELDFRNVADDLDILASLYRQLEEYEQAQSLYQRALALREETLGPDHHIVAHSLNNLALLYGDQRKYQEAEPLYQRALAIYEQLFGPNHSQTADSLFALAWHFSTQGKYEHAELLYQRALAIYEQLFGLNHPDVANCLSNLASLYRNHERYEQAELLYQRALAIREQVLGSDHQDTALTLYNLALLYQRQGRYEQSEFLQQRALAIREQVLKPVHPDLVQSFHSLATLYEHQGKYGQAELFYRRALSLCEQYTDPTDSLMIHVREECAKFLQSIQEEQSQTPDHLLP